ncbi:glycerophosphodiester phosphodiesterase [Knoellia sp. p5-6-4]|uniref:glycerophosphodiester phosphodiesterase n=1 Tax=unclassified Knoellia TaxID=2618719 RepID=UPI0023D9FC56|nr:glycerophosphodiester phosphodiesterase [Knoellia sp. p5-6-4]MDF2145369.1 glycerophosphodiester phosphodiesterase [Knoellia sp. p5-6-4]
MSTRTTVTLSVPRQRRVLVLGHRGSAGPQRAENSVKAVETSLSRGADGVEVDVRLSADGVLVCTHDSVLQTGGGDRLQVAAHTWGELHRAASRAGDRLANLEQVLAAAGRCGPCQVVVEAKPAADHASARSTVRAVQAALAEAPEGIGVTVSSFDWRLLAMLRGSDDTVRTAVLGGSRAPALTALRHALDAGHQEVHLSLAAIRLAPDVVRLARRLGVAVTAWTVNGREDLHWAAARGVDAVITDDVALARSALRAADSAPLEVVAS